MEMSRHLKKIVVANPIEGEGFSVDEILKAREKADKRATALAKEKWPGCEVLLLCGSVIGERETRANEDLWDLANLLGLIARADLAYFAHGYESSKVLKIAEYAANAFDAPVVVEDYEGNTYRWEKKR